MTARTCIILAGLFLGPLPESQAANPFADLLTKIEGQANAVLIMDVQGLHESALGQKQNWTKKHEENYLAHVSCIPPTVKRLVVGALLDPATLEPLWKTTVLENKEAVPLAFLARNEGGMMDQVSGDPVILTPRNSYLVAMGPKLIGVMRPANRQALGRWLRFTKTNATVAFSPYLRESLAVAAEGAQVVMAVDLRDVFDAEGIRRRLNDCKTIRSDKGALESLVKIWTGFEGFRFSVRVDESSNGELRLDFADPVAPLVPYVKALVLEAMDGVGAHVDDIQGWSVRAEGRAVILEGPLTEDGTRKALSLLLTPTSRVPSAAAEPVPGQVSQNAKATASVKYFKTLTTLLDDLRKAKADTFKQLAYWYYNTSKKIDELPVLNVDQDLLQFGTALSATLRNVSNMSRGVASQNTNLTMQAQVGYVNVPNYGGGYGYGYGYPYGYGYNPYYGNPYGGWGSTTVNVGQQAAYAAGDLQASESSIRNQTWTNIDNGLGTLRRKLTEKYQVEF
jgi:hypothetical protein